MTEGARLHFIKFETKHIETTLDYIQQSLLEANLDIKEVKVNIGGVSLKVYLPEQLHTCTVYTYIMCR